MKRTITPLPDFHPGKHVARHARVGNPAINRWLMRLQLLITFIVSVLAASYATESAAQSVTLHVKNVSLEYALFTIGEQTGYDFSMNLRTSQARQQVGIEAVNQPLAAVLDELLADKRLTYEVNDELKLVVIKHSPTPSGTDGRSIEPSESTLILAFPEVRGTVTDSLGQPLAGASIRVLNADGQRTTLQTMTDSHGEFTLRNVPEDARLEISYIGYVTLQIPAGAHIGTVVLKALPSAIEEVEINAGYYKVAERERTGSISRITSEEIEKQPINNPLEAMMGRIPGVTIVQNSGIPGGGFEVNIRGANSILAGSEPLYIIDGVPYDSGSLGSGNTSGSLFLGANISPLNAINPETIASIEVLKDADATAIYGSRGANGVVLITTKKGIQGRTRFTINGHAGIATIAHKMDLLNTEQYLEMRREAYRNDDITEYPANAYDVNGTWDQNRYTDWQEELIGKTARLRKLHSSISGGSEQTQYLLSGMLQEETTVYPGHYNYDRYTLNSNLNHKDKAGRFGLTFSAGYTIEKNNLPTDDYFQKSIRLAPNAPALYDSDGNLNWENNTWANPLASLNADYEQDTKTLIANLVLTYQFFNRLEFKINGGYGFTLLEDFRISPHTVSNPAFGLNSSSSLLFRNGANRYHYIVEPQISWEQQFGPHKLSTLLGTTFQEQTSDRLVFLAYDFPNNKFIKRLSAAKTLSIVDETENMYHYHALFARLNYSYKDKLFLNLTGRRDGSSRFGTGNRYGNFGAVGFAWLFSEDLEIQWLDYGKLRGSYGLTGNDQIGDYQYLDNFTIDNNLIYDANLGLQPSKLFNPNFQWEENLKKELGVELGLFEQQLSLSVGYYNNRSSNQLVNYSLPGTTGFTSILANLNAKVEQSGWEFDVTKTVVRNKDFSWNTSLNLTIPKSKLLAFPGLEESSYANRYVIGQPLSVIKLYQLRGVNPETGLFEFEDLNEDGLITSREDKQSLADLTPKFYGGYSNSVRYKNWSLDVFFQFVKKEGYNQFRNGVTPGNLNNISTSYLNRWQQPGDQAAMQRFTTGADSDAVGAYSLFRQSTGIVSDISFIRLKSLEVAYTLALGKHGSSCRIALQGQNLLTFTGSEGIDPEQQSTSFLPILRRVNLGVQFQF